MPTEEEWCAIIALANKAKGSYGELYDTANQYKIVMKWARKWLANKERVRKNANKWNKEHRERHRKTNLEYYYRNKDKIREYQKKYYEEVLKPKRQAQKERRKKNA